MNRGRSTSLLLLAVFCASSTAAPGDVADTMQETDSRPPSLDCVINPSMVADLGSGVPGVIDRMLVDRADVVAAGEVVAELESGVELASRDLARVRAEKDSEIELRRINAAFGKRQYERSEDLFQRKVISTNDIDERRTEAQLAGIQLRQALDNKELAALELERAEQVLRRRTIKSPIGGVVMERFKTIGEYVDEQPVLRVAQLDPLHIEVFVPVEQLGEIRPGMHADVWSDVVGGPGWKATVSRVDRVADVASGTYGVRLVLPNPDYTVPAGLRCRLAFSNSPPDPVAVVQHGDVPMEEAAIASADSVPDLAQPPARPGPAVAPAVVEPTQAVVSAAQEPPARVCLRTGPFDREAAAESVAGELRAQGMSVRVVAYETGVSQGFRAVSETFARRSDAEDFVERLKRAGISDYHLSPRTRGPVRVSLGLYRNAATLQRRLQHLHAQGFAAESLPWTKTVSRYALLVSGETDAEMSARLAELPAAVDDGSTLPTTCDQLAGG